MYLSLIVFNIFCSFTGDVKLKGLIVVADEGYSPKIVKL